MRDQSEISTPRLYGRRVYIVCNFLQVPRFFNQIENIANRIIAVSTEYSLNLISV